MNISNTTALRSCKPRPCPDSFMRAEKKLNRIQAHIKSIKYPVKRREHGPGWKRHNAYATPYMWRWMSQSHWTHQNYRRQRACVHKILHLPHTKSNPNKHRLNQLSSTNTALWSSARLLLLLLLVTWRCGDVPVPRGRKAKNHFNK